MKRIIEKVGKTKDAKYIISHKFYKYKGQAGIHTRLTGLPKEKYKELILKHLEKNKGILRDLQEALPELKAKKIANLLQEMKREGLIKYIGSKKTGYWTKI